MDRPAIRRPADPDLLEQLQALGAPPEVVAARTAAPADPPAPVEIWADHWPAWCWFLAAATQWRYAGETAVPLGLDYGGVEATARMAEIEVTPARFSELRLLETAAVSALLERRRS